MKLPARIGWDICFQYLNSENDLIRQNLYRQGGIILVTSRILVVDMLQSDIPTELITGLLVLHAEKYCPTLFITEILNHLI